MAFGSNVKTLVGTVALVGGCIVGLAATAYGVTTAFLMGAQAQADVDETAPADPRLLVRTTAQRLIRMTQEARHGTIELEEDAIEINTVE